MGYGMNTCVIIICPWKIYNLEKTLLAKKKLFRYFFPIRMKDMIN